MSRYATDPRVQAREGLFGPAYLVEGVEADRPYRPAVVEQDHHGDGWWACWQHGPEGRLVKSAPTADDAIRSLIGDPQA